MNKEVGMLLPKNRANTSGVGKSMDVLKYG